MVARRPFVPALALLAALASACGTTVPLAQQAGPAGAGGLGPAAGSSDGTTGAQVPGGTGSGPAPQPGGTSGSGTTTGSGSAAGGPQQGPPVGPAAAGQVPTGRAAASGRGFTKDTISIGVATAKDEAAFTDSFGISGTSTGDVSQQMNAIAADINRHGGVLGRKLVLVPHDYSTTQAATDPASANNAACVDWTQDHHVFAVVGPLIVEDTLLSCLAKSGTPLLELGGGVDYPLHYAVTYAKYPLFFNLAQMVGDRYDRIAVDRLKARGYFTPWDTVRGAPGTGAVTVGLVGFSDTDGERQLVDEAQQLKAHGFPVKDSDIVRCPRAITSGASCQQSAVLKLSSNHVTHVFGAALLFMNQAASQGYHPRYFIANSARVLAANAPAGQLNGAMGESYIPSYDVETSEYPGDPTAATGRCRRIMKGAGVDVSSSSVLYNALLLCDGFFFLQAAAERAGALGAPQLVAGLEGLGSRQPSTLTWSTFLGPGQHTSVHALRDLAYDAATKRWSYPDRVDRS